VSEGVPSLHDIDKVKGMKCNVLQGMNGLDVDSRVLFRDGLQALQEILK
jgi:hypothetical protein